jgi:6-phosphogluconolactonase
MEMHIGNSPAEVIENIANDICNLANESVKHHGRFTWALSGGSSPRALFHLLVTDYADEFPWDNTLFYFGDERFVPHDHPDSNYLMAKNAMLDPMNVNPAHVFPMDTSSSPEAGATAYQTTLQESFNENYPMFDLILLGLGDDAHTASLFPGTDVLDNDTDLVSAVYVAQKGVHRITLTKKLINNARNTAFLTYGENKANAVRQVINNEGDYHEFPAQLIKPVNGTLSWYIDEAAASQLN